MKISVTDKNGSGIMRELAKAMGTSLRGRFIHIPKSKGAGYLTGFSWGNELRMMVRNYYLNEEVVLERTNEIPEGQDNVIFFMSGIFAASVPTDKQVAREQPNVFIGMQAVSSVVAMPAHTFFRSISIAVSRQYLRQHFAAMNHPVISSILEASSFAFETGISPEMIEIAHEILHQSLPESIEHHYYKLKCEELLCYVFALLAQREATSAGAMHMDDIKAIYAIKFRLQSHLDEAPDIASLAREAGMSEPKMRKLFKQTFGKGVFEYYQYMRMHEAARLLKEKRLSVSEVGYHLGFSNLSHFTRVFEQHIGMKPKKYSVS